MDKKPKYNWSGGNSESAEDRALDKFTDRMFQANFDARGKDNMAGTYDDLSYQAQ